MARSYRRKEGFVSFTAATQSRLELSRNYHHQYLLCKLVVNHDNATGVALKTDHFANLINSIQIVANGSTTIKHVDASKLVFNAMFDAGRAMQNDVKTSVANGLVSTIYFTVDFSKRGMVRPADTIENAALYTTFDMLVDWANAAKVGSNITINSATLSVSSHQLVDYVRNPGERIARNVETQLTEEITSSTNEYQIQLPTKKIYQKILIAARVDGNRSNDVINSVKLKSGTTIFAEWNADDLRADNIDKNKIATVSDADGLLMLDLVGRKRNSDALDTRGQFNTLELVLDVTKQAGTNNVTVYTDTFEITDVIEQG